MRYNLEQAARAMWGIAEMVGDLIPADDATRRNTLSHVYVSLGAGQHLTAAERESYRRALKEHSSASNNVD